jgi:2-(1,2-epoxy-1,2-dihydrophenyl)acetyl-CoA isomerase
MMMASSGGGGGGVSATAEVIHDGIRTWVLSDKPIVAAVQGAVAGGGLGLMLSADYIVASDSAKFVSKYANIGLTPDLGVSTLLPAAIGQRRALQLLLQDRTLGAQEALDWGLVAEVVPLSDLAGRAEQVARFWLENATAAFGQAKRLIRVGAHRTFEENLADEAKTIGVSLDADESKVRVAAFAAASRKKAASTENP